MPQQNLNLPVIYAVVGAYRLIHDEQLWKPMWLDMHKAARQAGIVAAIWAVVTWPIQRLWVYYFMKGSAKMTGFSSLYHRFVADVSEVEASAHVGLRLPLPSLTTFAAFMFVLSQCSSLMEFWLRRKLRAARSKAYDATVRSRGKGADFWGPYAEEWEEPPTEKAIRQAKKEALYVKLASPMVRFVILKFALLPLDFIPFLSLFVGAYLRSLSLVRQLHQPLFSAKRMTPVQIELWITERQHAYRTYGFICAVLEALPIAGLFFSISNRVGAAMYAHDLEKRQALFRSGQVAKLKKSETYSVTDWTKPSGLREDEKVFANQLFDGAMMPGAQLGANSSEIRARTAGERMYGNEKREE